MSLLTLIPARGGSKGVPGKNVRPLNGKPLLWYAIDNARLAGLEPVVSTESAVVAECCKHLECTMVERPDELAGDDVPLWRVCQHHSNGFRRNGAKPDVLCLPPTTPFLKPETIQRALAQKADFVATVAEMTHPSLAISKDWDPVYPRQKREKAFYPTGALFLRSAELLESPHGPNCSGAYRAWVHTEPIEALNIDTEWDFQLCEMVAKHLKASGLSS